MLKVIRTSDIQDIAELLSLDVDSETSLSKHQILKLLVAALSGAVVKHVLKALPNLPGPSQPHHLHIVTQ